MIFSLHPHQLEAEAMLRASLKAGRKRPMLQAVTGFGKTILAARIIEGARARDKRVIVCVPAISLIDQTVEKFAQAGYQVRRRHAGRSSRHRCRAAGAGRFRADAATAPASRGRSRDDR